jgi:hypothetical protein
LELVIESKDVLLEMGGGREGRSERIRWIERRQGERTGLSME